MTTIFDRTATALATLSPAIPYALDVYLKSDAGDLPATFITYSLISGDPAQHADNDETLREYVMQVSIFSTAGLSSLPNVDAAMKAAGFQKGSERQLPRDAETRHFGLARDYHYLEDL
jgi:aminoglycoside phosphotransferase (APT) family kinase protein